MARPLGLRDGGHRRRALPVTAPTKSPNTIAIYSLEQSMQQTWTVIQHNGPDHLGIHRRYCANRISDTIAIYGLDPATGDAALLSHYNHRELHAHVHTRNMRLVDGPGGTRWLLAAHQDTNTVRDRGPCSKCGLPSSAMALITSGSAAGGCLRAERSDRGD